MPDHDGIGPQRPQSVGVVEQRFAFLDAGSAGGHNEGVALSALAASSNETRVRVEDS